MNTNNDVKWRFIVPKKVDVREHVRELFVVSKIDSFKSAIASQLIHIAVLLYLLLPILSARTLLCNHKKLLPLSRSSNFFQPFHQNIVV